MWHTAVVEEMDTAGDSDRGVAVAVRHPAAREATRTSQSSKTHAPWRWPLNAAEGGRRGFRDVSSAPILRLPPGESTPAAASGADTSVRR